MPKAPSLKETFEEHGLKVGSLNLLSKGRYTRETASLLRLNQLLKKQVEQEHSGENLAFLQKLHALYLLPDKNATKAQELYNEFISRQSATELNLPVKIANTLHKAAAENTLTLDSFNEAAHEIVVLISNDTMKRFKDTAEVKAQIQTLAKKPSFLERVQIFFSELMDSSARFRNKTQRLNTPANINVPSPHYLKPNINKISSNKKISSKENSAFQKPASPPLITPLKDNQKKALLSLNLERKLEASSHGGKKEREKPKSS